MIFGQLNISRMSTHSEAALQSFIYERGISLIAIQETGVWNPSDGFFTNKAIIKNKLNDNLSGVALIAENSLFPEHLDALDDDSVDAIWCQVKLNNKRVIIGSVYTKPSKDKTGLLKLLTHIKKVQNFSIGSIAHKFASILIYGDLNGAIV